MSKHIVVIVALAGNKAASAKLSVRERDSDSIPAVFNSESQAASFLCACIAKGTVVHADEAAAWDNLHERFEVKRINHQEAYSLDGACINMAEDHFSRLRRTEIGIQHHVAGSYLLRHAQESSWREDHGWHEDNGRIPDEDQVSRIRRALKRGRGVDFSGYRARHIAQSILSPRANQPNNTSTVTP